MTAVSVVVPAYNHARYLGRAIDSLLSQTHQAEVIALDDGSTDCTPEVLAGFGSRIRWLTQRNIGQAATLNKGWEMASGDVLGYLSADDFLRPRAIERMLEALSSDPEAMGAYPDFELVDDDSRRISVVRTPEFELSDMVLRAVCPPGPGALFRRDALRQAGGWNPALRQVPDLDFWMRLGLRGRLRRVPEVLACYRVHAGAQSFSRMDRARAEEMIHVIDAILASPALPPGIRSERARARANALLHTARLDIMSGRGRLGLGRVGEALALDPRAALSLRTYRLIASGLLWRLRTSE